MAVLQMQRVSICALKKDRKAILEKIQSLGIMEMNPIAEDEEGFEKMDTLSAKQDFEKKTHLTEAALLVLDEYAPEKTSMLSSLEGKKLLSQEQFQEAIERKEEAIQNANTLIAKSKEIAEKKAAVLKLENQIEVLQPWLLLDVPMTYEGTKKVALLLGTMAVDMTLERVYQLVEEHSPEENLHMEVQVIGKDKDALYLAVFCMREDARKVEEALRTGGFVRPSQIAEEIPAREKENLERQIESLKKEIDEAKEDIVGYKDKRKDLKVVGDYFRMRADKYQILGTIPQSQRTFLVSGYVPEKVVPAIEKAIGEKYDCVIDVEELGDEEEAPTLLENNGFSDCVEGIVESYGLPKKGEIDPTTIMSFFYVFFFGMMLSDAAYGAIIAIACFVLLKKFPRMSESMNKSIKLFMYCGISTIVWGVLFGGYFGNIVDIVSQKFFGTTVTIDALWFMPLNDPMKLLVYSMLFGVIHLFVGLGIKGYLCLRDHKVMDFFCDVVLWFLLLIGLILMLLPSDIFASIAQTKIVFPAAVHMLAKILAIVGAAGIVLMSGRSSKNPGLRLALGAYDLYNITGWLSDVLSYSRLLALGLATGVIASVINQMIGMFPNNVFGIILFVVFFVVGHALNLAINLLGAYVHTNRLQFVEFFGKFYEGGGRPFQPFHSNTKYVDIQK